MNIKIRTQISDEKFRDELSDALSRGEKYAFTKSNFYEQLRTEHKLEKARSLKLYDKYYPEIQKRLSKEADRRLVEATRAGRKSAVLTRIERLEIASEIARGKAWRVGDTVMIPNGNDRLKALDYLSRIEGDYAIIKADITTKGKEINNVISLDEIEVLREEINAMDKSGELQQAIC